MFKLPDLKYGYDALVKCMSQETMNFHYGKHHQAYVDKLNAAIEANPEYKNKSLEELLTGTESISVAAIKNNGGGHYNHSLFWDSMSGDGGGEPTGALLELIINKYGSFQKFVDDFTSKSMGIFGSGWAWLLQDGEIITTSNQDTPISLGHQQPLLCLDVWEHAYYIDHRNRRDEFIKSWWEVVDWKAVSVRLINQ
ncbi:MAG: superoxide dismutase [Candidatus Saccharimonadales bacterium]